MALFAFLEEDEELEPEVGEEDEELEPSHDALPVLPWPSHDDPAAVVPVPAHDEPAAVFLCFCTMNQLQFRRCVHGGGAPVCSPPLHLERVGIWRLSSKPPFPEKERREWVPTLFLYSGKYKRRRELVSSHGHVVV